MNQRIGEIERKTKETEIRIRVDLDDPSRVTAATSLPFLDHMLSAFACHGGFGLEFEARGDIEVDPHHLVEDCGITLGGALGRALEGSAFVKRAGFFIFPMDGSRAQTAIDLCGRPNLVWDVPLGEFPLGAMDPRLFRDFFKGLVDGLRATLHVRVPYGDGDHHVIEAVFKSFGRALREAVTPVDGSGPLSTKGVIDG
jgi:imidazoleglycerol-phosphate dehydratase